MKLIEKDCPLWRACISSKNPFFWIVSGLVFILATVEMMSQGCPVGASNKMIPWTDIHGFSLYWKWTVSLATAAAGSASMSLVIGFICYQTLRGFCHLNGLNIKAN